MHSFSNEHAKQSIFRNIGAGVMKVETRPGNRIFTCGADGTLKMRVLPDRYNIASNIVDILWCLLPHLRVLTGKRTSRKKNMKACLIAFKRLNEDSLSAACHTFWHLWVCSVHGFATELGFIENDKLSCKRLFSSQRLTTKLQAKGIKLDFKARFVVILLIILFS